jgi:hypothetical protein
LSFPASGSASHPNDVSYISEEHSCPLPLGVLEPRCSNTSKLRAVHRVDPLLNTHDISKASWCYDWIVLVGIPAQ